MPFAPDAGGDSFKELILTFIVQNTFSSQSDLLA